MKQTGQRGGFAALNSGNITDCYSLVSIQGGNGTQGGFAGVNHGTLTRCVAAGALKALNGGLIGARGGKQKDCCFFHNEKKGSSALKKLCDGELGKRAAELNSPEALAQLGFDMQEIWKPNEKKLPLVFRGKNWFYDIHASKLYPTISGREGVTVGSGDELRAFAARVNSGDNAARNACVTLTADIDLGGKAWTPIGNDLALAFCGLFDGGGHTVKNFTLSEKQGNELGFFGVLKGEVYNLSLDCRIKGGECVGAFAARCDGGVIGCCSAASEYSGKAGSVGGFVGNNSGVIFQCYAAGKIRAGASMLPLLIVNGALIAVIAVLLLLPNMFEGVGVYAPVPYDEDAAPLPTAPDATPVPQKTDENFVSFQFEQKITVNRATGACTFNFKNPVDSNHNIVVQLQFTDAQAIRVMGSTGRTAEEQARIESDPAYDADTYRTVLAESGSIPPGYGLTDLTLVAQPNGATLPAGDYNAMVYLMFYDVDTNARAMLESQLPVVISVE